MNVSISSYFNLFVLCYLLMILLGYNYFPQT